MGKTSDELVNKAKRQKPSQKLDFFFFFLIRESDWSHFTPACNDRKRKLCETFKEKIVKLLEVNLFLVSVCTRV